MVFIIIQIEKQVILSVGKNKTALGLEYCARFAGVFGTIHTIGATISLK